jgi:hypothetical protein
VKRVRPCSSRGHSGFKSSSRRWEGDCRRDRACFRRSWAMSTQGPRPVTSDARLPRYPVLPVTTVTTRRTCSQLAPDRLVLAFGGAMWRRQDCGPLPFAENCGAYHRHIGSRPDSRGSSAPRKLAESDHDSGRLVPIITDSCYRPKAFRAAWRFATSYQNPGGAPRQG